MAVQERARELVRKAVHVPGGLLPAVILVALGYMGSVALACYLTAYLGLGGMLAARRHVHLPIVYAGIVSTWRAHERFPVAAFEFLLAVLLVGLLFPIPVFLAAVALLGVGDGAAALVGIRWGRRPLPWNPRKTWEGLWAGILVGAPVAAVMAVVGYRVERMVDEGTLLPGDPTLNVVLLASLGTALVFLAARAACRFGWATRWASARPQETAMVLAASTLPAVFILRAPSGWFQAPVLGWDVGAGLAAGLVLVAAPLVMVAESRLARHDNLVVPLSLAIAVWSAGVLAMS